MKNNNNDDEILISSDTNDSSIICLEPTTTTNHMIKSTQLDLTQPNNNISKFQMLFEETIISCTDSSSQEANAENNTSVCDESSNLQECLEQNVFEETVFIDVSISCPNSVDKLSKSDETDIIDDNHRMSGWLEFLSWIIDVVLLGCVDIFYFPRRFDYNFGQ
jgi:hypothetical protein